MTILIRLAFDAALLIILFGMGAWVWGKAFKILMEIETPNPFLKPDANVRIDVAEVLRQLDNVKSKIHRIQFPLE